MSPSPAETASSQPLRAVAGRRPLPSAGDLVAMFSRREISPVEATSEALAVIEELDGRVGAFRSVFPERALEEAESRTALLSKNEILGPLHGVPVAIKELFDVEGATTSYGSRAIPPHTAAGDAVAVARLRAAGAIVVGITRTHEIGWGITTRHHLDGGTSNPWSLARVAGGSSGGSAAAVACGMATVALGSDTGGSIRVPSSFCGVAGLKPAHGAVSAYGAVALAPSLDHVGPIARTVADLERMWTVLRDRPSPGPAPEEEGAAWRHPLERVRGMRVAIAPGLNDPPLAPDIEAVYERAQRALTDAGCELVAVDLGSTARIRACFATVQMAEVYHVHNRVLGTFPSNSDLYGPDVRGRLEASSKVTLEEYLAARYTVGVIKEEWRAALAGTDVLLSPVAAGGPSTVADPDTVTYLGRPLPFRDLVLNYTVPQDLTGLPACSVAVGLDAGGLPVGVQVTAGRRFTDAVLLVAAALQEALPLPPPPLLAGAAGPGGPRGGRDMGARTSPYPS